MRKQAKDIPYEKKLEILNLSYKFKTKRELAKYVGISEQRVGQYLKLPRGVVLGVSQNRPCVKCRKKVYYYDSKSYCSNECNLNNKHIKETKEERMKYYTKLCNKIQGRLRENYKQK